MQLRQRKPFFFSDAVTPATKFRAGDIVHDKVGGEIGVVEFARSDGRCCVQWPSGTREWIHEDSLCGPLANRPQE